MKAQGSRQIVTVSSAAGRTAAAGSAVYTATKWGVGAFSEALRQEGAPAHLRVSVIEPGAVATEMQRAVTDQAMTGPTADRGRSIRPLHSEDIAGAIVYAVTQPAQVDVGELLIRPTEEVF